MYRKLSFTITEGPIYWRTHRIMELCDYLTAMCWNPCSPARARNGTAASWTSSPSTTRATRWSRPAPSVSRCRLCSPGGWANWKPRSPRNSPSCGSRPARSTMRSDPVLRTVKTILISITENPTALVAPPDVNMSDTRGCVVLRDLLGYQQRQRALRIHSGRPRQAGDLDHRGQDRRVHRQPGEGPRRSAPHAQPDQHEGGSPLPGRGETVRPLGAEP